MGTILNEKSLTNRDSGTDAIGPKNVFSTETRYFVFILMFFSCSHTMIFYRNFENSLQINRLNADNLTHESRYNELQHNEMPKWLMQNNNNKQHAVNSIAGVSHCSDDHKWTIHCIELYWCYATYWHSERNAKVYVYLCATVSHCVRNILSEIVTCIDLNSYNKPENF